MVPTTEAWLGAVCRALKGSMEKRGGEKGGGRKRRRYIEGFCRPIGESRWVSAGYEELKPKSLRRKNGARSRG